MINKIKTFIIHALGGVTEAEYHEVVGRCGPTLSVCFSPLINSKEIRPISLHRIMHFPDTPFYSRGDYALAKDELVTRLLKSIEAHTEFSEPRNIGFETIEIEAKVTVLPPGWDS